LCKIARPVLSYKSKAWATENKIIGAAEIIFLSSVAGLKLTDQKKSEDIKNKFYKNSGLQK
jgi:hypothetical protein